MTEENIIENEVVEEAVAAAPATEEVAEAPAEPKAPLKISELVTVLNNNFTVVSNGGKDFNDNLNNALGIIKKDIQILLDTIDAQANTIKELQATIAGDDCACECHDEEVAAPPAGEVVEGEFREEAVQA